MLKVGLTGGIGSGKSVVARIFNVLGIPVFDADGIAKKLMDENDDLREALIKEFGSEAYRNSKLNRPYLSSIVFNDQHKLDKLNALVHPVTIAAAENWMLQQDTPYVIKEAALLFEAGSAASLDYVIGVFAPLSLRLNRVIERDGVSPEQVQARMNRQISDTIKMRLCDFRLNNDEQSLLVPQVLSLHEKLVNLSGGS